MTGSGAAGLILTPARPLVGTTQGSWQSTRRSRRSAWWSNGSSFPGRPPESDAPTLPRCASKRSVRPRRNWPTDSASRPAAWPWVAAPWAAACVRWPWPRVWRWPRSVLVSYPLHPPGRPDKLRTAHFPDLHLPCLFVSGRRDAFGAPAELRHEAEAIPGPVTLDFVDGDHSLRKRNPEVADIVASWLTALR